MDELLIVEDDPDIRQDLAEILREEGYEVTVATNGAEALSYLRSGSRPCLILLDLMMPVMDGWCFRAAQLADSELSHIPVIVVSGAADARAAADDLKARGYLRKPFQLMPLLELVGAHC